MSVPVTLQTLFLALVWVCQGAATAAVVEYYTPELRHYFITASPAEQALVESGAMGLWTRTGGSFEAGGADPVCRFYGNTARNPATGASYGPNSHFYTVDAAECAGLQSAYRVDAPSWQFEGFGFQSTRSSGGLCAAPLWPVFRAYNQGYWRGIDSNHRLTADLGAYFETTAAGWAPEGVVMCAPPAPGTCSGAQLAWLEQAMNATLAVVNTDADFSLVLESFDGRRYHYARGGATPARSYESASTSKWVSAAVILSLVDRGFLSLESRPRGVSRVLAPAGRSPWASDHFAAALGLHLGFQRRASVPQPAQCRFRRLCAEHLSGQSRSAGGAGQRIPLRQQPFADRRADGAASARPGRLE